MKRRLLGSVLLALPLSACGSPPPAEEAPAPPPPEEIPAAVEPEAEPSAEEQAKKAELEALEQDRQKMRAAAQAERRRFTPELQEADEALVARKFATLGAALEAILKSEHRTPGNAARDAQRHPRATLEFFGVTPKSVVLEYGPGEGWYTEILAPLLHAQGQLLATTADPNGPADSRATFYAERFQLFLGKAPELYGKVTSVVIDPKSPDLKLGGTLDHALVIRGIHGMINGGTLEPWLATLHAGLKKNGRLGIEQHRASVGADPIESAKKGYVPEAWLIAQIEAAGFRLVAKSEINANPRDTKDYPDGVWTLPPTLKLGDTDRQKYLDIGESDRMTLVFTKVEKPAAKQ